MKKLITVLCLLGIFATGTAQEEGSSIGKQLAPIDVMTLDGKSFNMGDIDNDGKPIIITFWATWCKPCIKEHDAINDEFEDWVDDTGVKMYAISIDNARSSKKVLPFVNGKRWEFEDLLDENGDLKRAMGVNVPPHTFVLDAEKKVVYEHVGYLEGDEVLYIEAVEKIIAGEELH